MLASASSVEEKLVLLVASWGSSRLGTSIIKAKIGTQERGLANPHIFLQICSFMGIYQLLLRGGGHRPGSGLSTDIIPSRVYYLSRPCDSSTSSSRDHCLFPMQVSWYRIMPPKMAILWLSLYPLFDQSLCFTYTFLHDWLSLLITELIQ